MVSVIDFPINLYLCTFIYVFRCVCSLFSLKSIHDFSKEVKRNEILMKFKLKRGVAQSDSAFSKNRKFV